MNPATFVFATGRTLLTPFRPQDVDELLVLFRDPAVRGYLLDDVVVTDEWMAAEIAASQRRFAHYGTGLWAVRRLGEPAIVGFAGFREFLDPPQLQLLYGFLPCCRGQGLATEVTRHLCGYAFGELERDEITATVDGPNRASVRVLEHLGMRCTDVEPDGTRQFAVDRDRWAQAAVHAAGTAAG